MLVEVHRDAAAHEETRHSATWRDPVAGMAAEPRASTTFSAVFAAGDRRRAG